MVSAGHFFLLAFSMTRRVLFLFLTNNVQDEILLIINSIPYLSFCIFWISTVYLSTTAPSLRQVLGDWEASLTQCQKASSWIREDSPETVGQQLEEQVGEKWFNHWSRRLKSIFPHFPHPSYDLIPGLLWHPGCRGGRREAGFHCPGAAPGGSAAGGSRGNSRLKSHVSTQNSGEIWLIDWLPQIN